VSISFHNASVGSYLQVLEGVAGVLDKGASHATEAGLDLKEVVMTRLRDDMMPLHFQVVSVAHHSWGAMQALQQGQLQPTFLRPRQGLCGSLRPGPGGA